MVALPQLLEHLKERPTGHSFTAAPIEEREGIYLALDQSAHPCIFLRAAERLAGAPIRTSGLLFLPNEEYVLTFENGPAARGRYHLLACLSSQGSEVESFLVLVQAFLLQPATASRDEGMARLFQSLVRLFAVPPARDLRAERQGLWGELFLMSRVRGFEFWAPYWHSEPTRVFDFLGDSRRVEVKTALGPERVHHFSHKQVYGKAGEEILIASLLLEEDKNGLSLSDLIADCRERLRESPHCLKVERAARQAGMVGTVNMGPSYNPISAERSLAWFKANDIPHFRLPEPVGVSETRYKAELSNAPPLSPMELDAWLSDWPL
jgi:hypothetical protein